MEERLTACTDAEGKEHYGRETGAGSEPAAVLHAGLEEFRFPAG